MLDEFRPLISRVIASFAPAIVLWFAEKLSTNVSEDMVKSALELGVALAIYGLTHRAVDRKLSPGDAASPKLAAYEKREDRKVVL